VFFLLTFDFVGSNESTSALLESHSYFHIICSIYHTQL